MTLPRTDKQLFSRHSIAVLYKVRPRLEPADQS
jgi:hypothetical protein